MARINTVHWCYFCRYISHPVILAKHSARQSPNNCTLNTIAKRNVVTATDILDSFTEKLIQEKSTKWKNTNAKKITEDGVIQTQDVCGNYINYTQNLNDADLTTLIEDLRRFINSSDCQNIVSLLSMCHKKKFSPSISVLLEAASVLSRNGNKPGIDAIQSLCKIFNRNEYLNQAEFRHHLAEVTWIKGNVKEALNIFEDVYKHHVFLRRKVRHMTSYLITECVSNRSEASVVLIIDSAKKFAVEYKDFYFVACLWQCLFLSEWFADQKVAHELLQEFSNLRVLVADRLIHMASKALRQGQNDIVQRLCEIALRYEMRKQCHYILRSLFDYKYSQGDLKGCAEIIAAAKEVNISLTAQQHDKYVALLVDHRYQYSWFSTRKQMGDSFKQLQVPRFQMKF